MLLTRVRRDFLKCEVFGLTETIRDPLFGEVDLWCVTRLFKLFVFKGDLFEGPFNFKTTV